MAGIIAAYAESQALECALMYAITDPCVEQGFGTCLQWPRVDDGCVVGVCNARIGVTVTGNHAQTGRQIAHDVGLKPLAILFAALDKKADAGRICHHAIGHIDVEVAHRGAEFVVEGIYFNAAFKFPILKSPMKLCWISVVSVVEFCLLM